MKHREHVCAKQCALRSVSAEAFGLHALMTWTQHIAVQPLPVHVWLVLYQVHLCRIAASLLL